MYSVLDVNRSSPSLIFIPLGLCIIEGWNIVYMIIIPIQGIYIYIYDSFHNMPRQAEGGDCTRSLDRKKTNETRGRGLVRTSAS